MAPTARAQETANWVTQTAEADARLSALRPGLIIVSTTAGATLLITLFLFVMRARRLGQRATLDSSPISWTRSRCKASLARMATSSA